MFRKFHKFERTFVAQHEGEGTGGTGGTTTDKGDAGKGGTGGAGTAPDPKALADENAKLKAELEKMKAGAGKTNEDPDLAEKARKDREAKEAEASKTRTLENALKFNMNSADFLKQNEQILPKEIAEIFSQAEKEQYGDAVQKVTAVKEGVVRAFFAVQANRDLLTEGLKSQLDGWLKLTKDGRLEKANSVYETLLEPTLDRLKAERKAAALNKGYGSGDSDAYKKKLMQGSHKHYGVKENGA